MVANWMSSAARDSVTLTPLCVALRSIKNAHPVTNVATTGRTAPVELVPIANPITRVASRMKSAAMLA